MNANPPEKVNNTGDLLLHVKKIAERAILDKNFRETSPLLVSLYNVVSKTELPPAFQGIIVGGRTAKDIRILNNTIIGTLQGIHVGVSHSAPASAQPDKAGTVTISGNNIETHLFSAKNERHGIFVGNCDSLLVEGNYIKLKYNPKKKIKIEGIHVYGHFGKFMIIRQNHVVDFRTGIFVKPLNVVSTPLWLVQYNMLQNSEKQVVAPDKVKKDQNYA
jgi:nitrous oxidase accessory protein NosD